jgi:hypothetical protein
MLAWGACLLLLGTIAALFAAATQVLGDGKRDRWKEGTMELRRIAAEAREAMDRLSEAYLREVENLFNHHPRR